MSLLVSLPSKICSMLLPFYLSVVLKPLVFTFRKNARAEQNMSETIQIFISQLSIINESRLTILL